MSASRKAVHTDAAPAAIGAYSHAVVSSGGCCSAPGQIPLDPASGELVEGGVGEQDTRCLENLEAVCEAGGTTLADAVRLTVYAADLAGDWAEINEAYAAVLRRGRPPGAGGDRRRGAAEGRARGDRRRRRAAGLERWPRPSDWASRTPGGRVPVAGVTRARRRCCRRSELSRQLGGEIWLKRENLQVTGSFKVRGASTGLAALSEAERAAGVVAASAGNHAQARRVGGARGWAARRRCSCPPRRRWRRSRRCASTAGRWRRSTGGYDEASHAADELRAPRAG